MRIEARRFQPEIRESEVLSPHQEEKQRIIWQARGESSEEKSAIKRIRRRLRLSNQDHHRKEEPKPSRASRIIVEYDGLVSNKMVWREDRLDLLAEWADLRSQVVIRCGQERPKVQYTSLGEVLVWRALANPLDLFRKEASIGEEATITTNLPGREIIIRINDQIIKEHLRDHQGEFEPAFVERFNSVLNTSLKKALWEEKVSQAVISLKITSIIGLHTIGNIGLGCFVWEKVGRIISNLSPSFIQEKDFPIGRISLGIILGSFFTFKGFAGFLRAVLSLKKDLIQNKEGYPYFQTGWDLNPFKHLKDGLKARFYLSTKGKEIVSYQLHSSQP